MFLWEIKYPIEDCGLNTMIRATAFLLYAFMVNKILFENRAVEPRHPQTPITPLTDSSTRNKSS